MRLLPSYPVLFAVIHRSLMAFLRVIIGIFGVKLSVCDGTFLFCWWHVSDVALFHLFGESYALCKVESGTSLLISTVTPRFHYFRIFHIIDPLHW